MDSETLQMILGLINPLHGKLDKQCYDEKLRESFDAEPDAELEVTITFQDERNLNQAVLILESKLRDAALTPAVGES